MTSADRHSIRIQSPAKINLFLQVIGKRPDHYHELRTLMCPISLYDTITLTLGGKKIVAVCSHPDVPEDDTNLAHRAAAVFLASTGSSRGVRVYIEKRIPVAAGLGGGSSNAAWVLMALNRLFGEPFDPDRLMKMGCDIGADVPFFIFNRPALATGIGEKLMGMTGLKPYGVVLVYPGFKISTADVYKNFTLRLTNREKIFKNSSFINKVFDATCHVHNDLETVTASRFPEIDAIKSLLVRLGAMGAAMSGSGPTVFGLYTNRGVAQDACTKVHADHPEWQVFVVDLLC